MPDNLAQELALLPRLGVADLRRRYAELFGETTRTGNKAWLVKRLAWRLDRGDLTLPRLRLCHDRQPYAQRDPALPLIHMC